MSETRPYATSAAFRQALTDRLKVVAGNTGWTLQELQRHFAFDRLLERLYRQDQAWVLKGAAALLARDLAVRATVDIDLYRDTDRDAAEEQLREAARRDLGDWFQFVVGAPSEIAGGAAVRLPVTALIVDRRWVTFRVDLVGAGVRMTGEPEHVPPLVRLAMPQVEQRGYRAYPLVDHVADKVVATFGRYREVSAISTRYKDLVDLVAIAGRASIEAEAQGRALFSLADQRGIVLPDQFHVPDRGKWERGYADLAGQSQLQTARTLDEALAVVRPFLDPVLNRTASGVWDPRSQRWEPGLPGGEIPARAATARRTVRTRTASAGPRRRTGRGERRPEISR